MPETRAYLFSSKTKRKHSNPNRTSKIANLQLFIVDITDFYFMINIMAIIQLIIYIYIYYSNESFHSTFALTYNLNGKKTMIE
ncbi:unnamed protein product [Rotaria magnacalcarata]